MSEVKDRPVTTKPDVSFQRKAQKPKLYDVRLKDEAQTNCNCGITILMDVFNLDIKTAINHRNEAALLGSSVIITETREIAEIRAHQASQEIPKHQQHNPFVQLLKFDIKQAP